MPNANRNAARFVNFSFTYRQRLGANYCHELYFFGVRRKIEEKYELKYYMDARQERTAIRKYRGGEHRGVAYALR